MIMSKKLKWFIVIEFLVILLAAIVYFAPMGSDRAEITLEANVERGNTLLKTAGCYACHTDLEQNTPAFAGGPKLETPFGDFYAPNISSSEEYGIGRWSILEFEKALRQGVSPEKHAYYPAFPFSSYRSLTDQDVVDLFAALNETTAIHQAANSHDMKFPFNIRLGLKPWRWLFATTKSNNIDQTTALGRGRYLVEAVAHCGECHNPRNSIGAFIPPYLSGNDEIPGGVSAPAITGRALSRMDWIEEDLMYFLDDGILPDGDSVGGSMVEVIDFSTSQMTSDDREAMAAFLFSIK